MPEVMTPHEASQSPEALGVHPNAALHTRLLLAENALNPEYHFSTPVIAGEIKNFEDRDYSAFTNASNRERKRAWEHHTGTSVEKRHEWSGKIVEVFGNNKEFFESDAGKRWKQIYQVVGIDAVNFTPEEATTLYETFFTGQNKESQVKEFAGKLKDFLKTSPGDSLEVDLQAVEWLGNIFGKKSATLIKELVTAETILEDDTQKASLLAAANNKNQGKIRINDLTPYEHDLLSFVWGNNKKPHASPNPHPIPEPGSPSNPRPRPASQEADPGARTTTFIKRLGGNQSPEPARIDPAPSIKDEGVPRPLTEQEERNELARSMRKSAEGITEDLYAVTKRGSKEKLKYGLRFTYENRGIDLGTVGTDDISLSLSVIDKITLENGDVIWERKEDPVDLTDSGGKKEAGEQDPITEKIIAGKGFEVIEEIGWEKYRKSLEGIPYGKMMEHQITEAKKLPVEGLGLTADNVIELNRKAKERLPVLEREFLQAYPKNGPEPFFFERDDDVAKLVVRGRNVDYKTTSAEKPLTRIYFNVYTHKAPEAFRSLFTALKDQEALNNVDLALFLANYRVNEDTTKSYNNTIIIYVPNAQAQTMEKVSKAVRIAKEKDPQVWEFAAEDEARARRTLVRNFNVPLDASTGMVEMPTTDSYDLDDKKYIGFNFTRHRNPLSVSPEELMTEVKKFNPENPGTFTGDERFNRQDMKKGPIMPYRRKYMPALVFRPDGSPVVNTSKQDVIPEPPLNTGGRSAMTGVEAAVGAGKESQQEELLPIGSELMRTAVKIGGSEQDKLKKLFSQLTPAISPAEQQEILREARKVAQDIKQTYSKTNTRFHRGQVHYANQIQTEVEKELQRLESATVINNGERKDEVNTKKSDNEINNEKEHKSLIKDMLTSHKDVFRMDYYDQLLSEIDTASTQKEKEIIFEVLALDQAVKLEKGEIDTETEPFPLANLLKLRAEMAAHRGYSNYTDDFKNLFAGLTTTTPLERQKEILRKAKIITRDVIQKNLQEDNLYQVHQAKEIERIVDEQLVIFEESAPIVREESGESENVARSLDALKEFAKRETLEPKEMYEESLDRAIKELEGKSGIVEIDDLPTIVISDLHARRDFLVEVMDYEYKGQKVFDLLKESKVNVVCVGDGMHSESARTWLPRDTEVDFNGNQILNAEGNPIESEYGRVARERENVILELYRSLPGNSSAERVHWFEKEEIQNAFNNSSYPKHVDLRNKYERLKVDAITGELTRSLGLMKMVMDLKASFPTNFHYTRGNHDDMAEVIASQTKQPIHQSELVKSWVKAHFGEEFLNKWAKFEAQLPLMVKKPGLVVSHTVPERPLAEKALQDRTKLATYDITWGDNTDLEEPKLRESVDQTLQNIHMPSDTLWLIGHRKATEGNYRSQLNGQIIQINNPDRHIIAVVPNNRDFDPDQDVITLN